MIAALRRAVPYLRLYKGKTFVIKADGALFEDAAATSVFIEQIAILHHLGIRIVLVQGAGARQTDVLEICRELGIDAVGDIVSTDRAVLARELDTGLVPVVGSTDASDPAPDADAVAASIGAALVAEKLIFCTSVAGVLERAGDPHSLVSYTDLAGLRRLAKTGSLEGGFLPDLSTMEAAMQGGVRRVHVISWRARDSLLAEVFTNEGTGTLIVADIAALTPAELQLTPAVA